MQKNKNFRIARVFLTRPRGSTERIFIYVKNKNKNRRNVEPKAFKEELESTHATPVWKERNQVDWELERKSICENVG